MKKTGLALALVMVSGTVYADAFIYAGANFGRSTIGDTSSSVYGVHVGTGIMPFIGLEGGYQTLGDFKNDTLNLTADISTIYIAAKPSVDVGPVQVYAKAGLHSWRLDSNYNQIDNSGTDLMYGLGAEYFLMDNFAVGASWTQFNLGDDLSDNASVLALTATFHFL